MKILIVPKNYLGDTILATPLIVNLVRRYPQAEIWVLTNAHAAQLLVREDLLTGIVTYDRHGRDRGLGGLLRMARRLGPLGFDRVYALQRSPRTAALLFLSRIPQRIGFANAPLSFLYTRAHSFSPGKHEVQRNLELLAGDIAQHDLEPALKLVPPACNDLDKALSRVIPRAGTYAVMVPGSSWPTKRWHWQGYRDVARFLVHREIPVVLDGAPGDRDLNARVGCGLALTNLAGRSGVADAMYLIGHAALVICNDSMALHLASALKVPCVAIFCATSPSKGFGPWRNRAVVVQDETLGCRPCGRHGGHQCPTSSKALCREVDSQMVIRAVQTLLAR
ncbi:MAG: glycosyltransferase family 9 protein [Desulfobacterales bacterium]